MNQKIRRILLYISALRLIPHLLILTAVKHHSPLRLDIARWTAIHLAGEGGAGTIASFIALMTRFPEFRNVFYYRVGIPGRVFSFLCPPLATLYIATRRIGPGLFIQHGFATIIAAKEIGANCWINQQVTIGYRNAEDQPTIHDNVTITAGAKVIGKVTVGSNATIGANAVVVKDVPPDTVVVGVPARIIRRHGKRVDEAL